MDDEKRPPEFNARSSLVSDTLYYQQSEELNEPSGNSLHRGLNARQISMIALGGAVGRLSEQTMRRLLTSFKVGTGLIIGSGTALTRGGPLGIFLGYGYVSVFFL